MKVCFYLLIAFFLFSTLSCKYDDQELRESVEQLDARLKTLEELCNQMNTNISSLQTLVNALQQNDAITAVTPILEGEQVKGYTITFAKNSPITIYNGQSGNSPVIGVIQDTDGIYYWTSNGDWLLDQEGKKIKASGADGKDGKDGIAPQIKIENEHWWLSADNGNTWTDYGQAKGDNGDAFFKYVDNSADNYVVITFSDDSFIQLPKLNPLSIHFDTQELVTIPANGNRDIHYTIKNFDVRTTVEVVSSSDLKAKVIPESTERGTIHIEALGTVDEYSKVLVFVSDSVSRITTAKLTFEESVIQVNNTPVSTIEAQGGTTSIHFLSNIEYEIIIEESATTWLALPPDVRSVESNMILLSVQPNTGDSRCGKVTVQDKHSNMQLTYLIVQSAPIEIQLQKERKALMDLYNSTNGASWTNNTNWGSEKPVSEWYGIRCNSNGSIYDINLAGNNLQGKLLASIGDFTNLLFLDLEYNQLCEGIPQEIGNLKQLIDLRLGHNNFTKELPESLSSLCQSLRSLKIGANNIPNLNNTIHILSELKYLGDLDIAAINNNGGPLPASLTQIMDLPRLTYFNISYCGLSGNIPTEIQQHARWNDFVFHILPQGNTIDRPIEEAIGGFNMDGVVYNVSDFSVKDIKSNILNYGTLKKNSLTLIVPISCGNENGLSKIKELYGNYHKKGLGIITFFRMWTPWAPTDEERWIEEIIQKYNMTWYNVIETSDNRINNLPNVLTSSWGVDSYPSGCVVVDCDGRVLFNADMDGTDKLDSFIDSFFGKVNLYESTDYSQDGQITDLRTSSGGNSLEVVLLGDGFTDKDIANGTYDQIMEKAAEHFFSTEPIASYQSHFNVRSVKAVSRHSGFASGKQTALSCQFGEGTLVSGDDNKCIEYAQKISGIDLSRTVILVLLNDIRYAGTCYMSGDNLSIAYCPVVDGVASERFAQIINHEAVGHGFAKLGDEYSYEQNGLMPDNEIEQYRQQQQNGWWGNVDFTSSPDQISWKNFLADNRYSSEQLGIFEGALTYMKNVYKSTTNSIMNTNTGIFNAPSREAIYKRIMTLINGNSWQYNYEEFVAQDVKNIPSTISSAWSRKQSTEKFVPLHAPIVKQFKY